jgi:pimeloyl-ACP methyl ester carboxylesterase
VTESRAAQPIEIALRDGAVLRGTAWGEGDGWLVLLHDLDDVSDLDVWRPLMPAFDPARWRVVALDLRGHGASDGDTDPSLLEADLEDVASWARGQGAEWLAILACGRTAAATLSNAESLRFDALAAISLDLPADAERSVYRGRGVAKAFVVGNGDERLRGIATDLRNRSIGWAMAMGVPGDEQGGALLRGRHRRQVRDGLVAFLAEQRFISGTRRTAQGRGDGTRHSA